MREFRQRKMGNREKKTGEGKQNGKSRRREQGQKMFAPQLVKKELK